MNIRAARFRGENLRRGCPENSMASRRPLTMLKAKRGGFLLFSHVERKMRLHSTWLHVPTGERRKLSGEQGRGGREFGRSS